MSSLKGIRVLVTGGAGYIGSHALLALKGAGADALSVDNLATGNKWAVLYGDLVVADISDKNRVTEILRAFKPHAVMHFAASISIEESVRDPRKYHKNNTENTLALVAAMIEAGVGNLIYSSSAAVYGQPDKIPVTEDSAVRPINPYGSSKAASEAIVMDAASKRPDFRCICLRYFNVVGADPDARIGEAYAEPTHLITLAMKAALGHYPGLKIFGRDYPTPDGTCVRDYIHVCDVAEAHVSALAHLVGKGGSGIFNCGYGHGASVLEVVNASKKITGINFGVIDAPRRAGDPAVLVADASLIRSALGWRPSFDDLEYIIETAWKWEQRLAELKDRH